jgi:hypothetical protein
VERDNVKRAEYLRTLRKLIPDYGSDNIIYMDDPCFAFGFVGQEKLL